MKQCTCCKQLKPETEFNKCNRNIDGLQYKCKACQKKQYYDNHQYYLDYDKQRTKDENRIKYKQLYDYKYYRENIEQSKKYHKQRYLENRESILNLTVEQRQNKAIKRKIWYESNKDRLNKAKQQKRDSNPMYRFNECVSSNIYYSLKQNKACKHWEELVDFTFDELKEHLESQFDENMSWNNRGTYWEIDHIIPVNTFSFNSPEDKEFKICWSLANLRPLEKIANRKRPKDGSDISKDIKDKIMKGLVVCVKG